jgi:hypothetical protein
MLASIHLLRTPEFWPGQRAAYVKAFTSESFLNWLPWRHPVSRVIPTRDRGGVTNLRVAMLRDRPSECVNLFWSSASQSRADAASAPSMR